MQRVEDLGLVQRILRDVAFAQRRHPQVDERLGKVRTAQAADTLGRHDSSIRPRANMGKELRTCFPDTRDVARGTRPQAHRDTRVTDTADGRLGHPFPDPAAVSRRRETPLLRRPDIPMAERAR